MVPSTPFDHLDSRIDGALHGGKMKHGGRDDHVHLLKEVLVVLHGLVDARHELSYRTLESRNSGQGMR